MTKPISASDNGLEPYYKVRVVLPGVVLHLASWDEPQVDEYDSARWIADWIDIPEYGDTIGYINWGEVTAITWRYSE